MKSAQELGLSKDGIPAWSGWRAAVIAWIALVAAILVVLRNDVADMVSLWWNTDTFGHCLLIPAILAYLVWLRRAELSVLQPRPWLPAATALLIGGIGWMLGELAGVALVRHAAVVGLLVVSVPLVFGLTIARALTFVLFYALFMIPAGEQLVPLLQTVTAWMSIELLGLTGIPAYIDGVFISIPNGNFEVAEACSGVRFLIAMIAFSVLVAHLCFKGWGRRIAFVASAIALSIIANGIRAFGTIYISHLTTPAFAAGVDHIIYGWIFFAIVMAVLIAAGWPFFDRPVDDPAFDPARLQPVRPAPAPVAATAMAAVLGTALFAAGPVYGAYANRRLPDHATAMVTLPDIAGWRREGSAADGWQPHYKGAAATGMARYVDDAGQPIDLYVAVFDRQSEDGELVGYRQGLLPPDSDWAWSRNERNPPRGRATLIKLGDAMRENVQYYSVNGVVTGSDYAVKVETLKAKLLGGPPRAATLVVSAPRNDPQVSARSDIDRFLAALGPVEAAIRQTIIEEGE